MKFDLTVEPWIPVMHRRRVREVSLAELFSTPWEFDGLAVAFPQERIALIRMLVAIMQSAVDVPADNALKERWLAEPATCLGAVRRYLDKWRGRFDLFDAEQPFMQQPVDKDMAGETTVAALGIDWASGNNVTLFDHNVDSRPPAVAPAKATRLLLTTLLCQPGGGVSKPFNRTDSPGTKPVMATAIGRDLWLTLVANCPEVEPRDLKGRPAWERYPGDDRPDKDGTTPAGWLDLATWRSRAIQLYPDKSGQVRRLRMHQHLKLAEGAPRDPFVPVVRKEGEDPKPLRLRVATRVWQQADAVYHGLVQPGRPTVIREAAWLFDGLGLSLLTFVAGLGVRQAKISDSRGANLPVSHALLESDKRRELVGDAISAANDGSRAVFAAARAYCECVEDDKLIKSGGAPALAGRLQEPYWADLEPDFATFAAHVASAPEDPSADHPIWHRWTDSVREAALRSGDAMGEFGGGGSLRELKGIALARSTLRRSLSRQIPYDETREVENVAFE